MIKKFDAQQILELKMVAAKKDLKDWKGFSDKVGQLKQDDPNFEPCFSCQFMGISKKDNLAYCRGGKYGKCVFYRCQDRPTYLEWLEHHRQFHPKEDMLYVSCNECNNIRNKEVAFFADRIGDLEMELNQCISKSMRKDSLRDIAKKMNVK